MRKLSSNIIIVIVIVIFLAYSILPTGYYKITGTPLQKTSNEEKYLCLTFDDGPNEEYTGKLLDLLNKYDVKATFFVVADKAEKYPQIIEEIKNEGHSVQLHSLEHKNALIKGPIYTNEDFKKSLDIMNKLKTSVKFYRPPKGNINIFTLINIKKYDLYLVLWDVSVGDWKKNITADEISQKLIREVKNKDVICLHEHSIQENDYNKTIEALEDTLVIWKNEGFKFLKVDEVYE